MTGPPAADGVLVVSCRGAAGSVSAGLAVGGCIHFVAAAIFVVMWHLQRATTPACFPDEDGVFVTLVLALTADALGAVTWGVAARRRRRFMWGLALAWLVGLIAVAAGTLNILAFIVSLGMGCSDSYRTPW